jgi:hypothetical protein
MNAQPPPPAVVSSVSAYVIGNYSPRGAATHWDSIPRGSVLHVPGYGRFVVDDRAGPAVPRPYGIDIRCWRTKAECMQFGRRTLTVRIDRPEATSRSKGGRDENERGLLDNNRLPGGFAPKKDHNRVQDHFGGTGIEQLNPNRNVGQTMGYRVARNKGAQRVAGRRTVSHSDGGGLRLALLTGLLWGGAVGLLLIFVIMKWGWKR